MAYKAQFADASQTIALRWKERRVSISLSTSLLKSNADLKTEKDVLSAINRSLESWEAAAGVKFEVDWTDAQTVSPAGKSGDGTNLITIAQTPENLSLFAGETDEISARTRVFFSRKGFITEADIVLNPYQQFSVNGLLGTFDFEATITHELGHLLGLDHSSMTSATMFARQGKNGVFNLPGFASRTLAEDDIIGIRSLYGTKNVDEEGCCGKLQGKLTAPNGKTAKDFQVWIEEKTSGRVIGDVLTDADGSFNFDAVEAGIYKIYAQSLKDKKDFWISEELGEIEIKKDKTANFAKKIRSSGKDFHLQYIGFNNQLSELAVPVNGGKSYKIFIGGKNLKAKDLEIVFATPFVKVAPESLSDYDFGSQITVVSFDIIVHSQTPLGQYSFQVKNAGGANQYFVGGITLEKFANYWSEFLGDDAGSGN